MNILFTSPTPFHPERGGVGRVTDILCKEFIKNNDNVYYLNLSWYSDDRKNYKYPTMVHIFPEQDINSKRNVLFYNKFIEDNNIDIIINQDGLSYNSKLFLNVNNVKVKKLSVFHNDPFFAYSSLWTTIKYLRDNSIMEKIKRVLRFLLFPKIKYETRKFLYDHFNYIYNHSDAIIFLSNEYKNKMERYFPKMKDKLYVINNPNSFDPVLSIPLKENIILYVGRLSNREKRIDRLINIWELLSKQYDDWFFYIIGDGTDKDFLMKNVLNKKIKNIKFIGSANPFSYYQKASIVCLSSNYEGLPMTLIEGMQFGCVPICFDSFSAAHEIIQNGITGELVRPYDLNEYRHKLEKLISDIDYRKRVSTNAFNASKRYDKEKIVCDWYNLFKKI